MTHHQIISELKARLAACVEVLKECEWAGGSNVRRCPSCRQSGQHADGCKLAQAIAEAKE